MMDQNLNNFLKGARKKHSCEIILKEMTQGNRFFENIMGKGENNGNHHFLFFSKSIPLLVYQRQILPFEPILWSATAFSFNPFPNDKF